MSAGLSHDDVKKENKVEVAKSRVPSAAEILEARRALHAASAAGSGFVLLFHAAAGDAPNLMNIYHNRGSQGGGVGSSLVDIPAWQKIEERPQFFEPTVVVAVDQIFTRELRAAAAAVIVGFKVDAQGFDLNILRGAEAVLPFIELLFLEYYPRGLQRAGATPAEYTRYVAQQNFLCFEQRRTNCKDGSPRDFDGMSDFYTNWTRSVKNTRTQFGPFGDLLCVNTQASAQSEQLVE